MKRQPIYLLLLVISLTPSPRGPTGQAAAQEGPSSLEEVSAAIEDELERQEALLERLDSPPSTGASDESRLEPIPAALFEEAPDRIPRGKWGNDAELAVLRLVLDADGDGAPERIHYLDAQTRVLLRIEEDRNYDGRMDAWRSFEDGQLVRKALDETGDGEVDIRSFFRGGKLVRREIRELPQSPGP